MGQWAEEKRAGTDELLFTLPVTDVQLLLGKWLASAAFLFIVLFFTLPLPFSVHFLGELDCGQVVANYVGAFLMGCAYLSFGLLLSSLARNQIVAFLLSVVGLFLFFILASPVVTDFLPKDLVPWAQFLSVGMHFDAMAKGVIDLRDVTYFVSGTGLFLYLNAVSLQARKWS
jgi:ABC-2 type transport system permease protein